MVDFFRESMQDAPIGDEQVRENAARGVEAGDLFVWENDNLVTMAMRNRPTPNGIAISYVYTPPDQRRKGYASACVAALSQLLLDSGWKMCSLFTDLQNPSSNRIYMNIGYKPVGDYSKYRFL
jgi:uncharacterized protein